MLNNKSKVEHAIRGGTCCWLVITGFYSRSETMPTIAFTEKDSLNALVVDRDSRFHRTYTGR